MSRRRWYKTFLCLAILAVFILIPVFVTNLYRIGIITKILVDILLVVSLWLITTTGQISLGHGAFAAIGGFISAALITSYGLNSWISFPIAVVTAGLIGLVMGYITLRIKGVYFVIATLALGEFVNILFGMWEHPFGGLHGLINLPLPDAIEVPGLFTIQFRSNVEIYYLTLLFTVIGIIIIYRVYMGPIGRVFRSISQADELADSIGINIMRYKVLAFVIGCLCAGLAGVLYTYSTQSISPTSFTIIQSAYYLLCIVVGGGASIIGPIIGAVFLGAFTELARPVQEFEPILFGILLAVCILFFKSGVLGVLQKIWQLCVSLINKMISIRRTIGIS